jgi:hypothetical protein
MDIRDTLNFHDLVSTLRIVQSKIRVHPETTILPKRDITTHIDPLADLRSEVLVGNTTGKHEKHHDKLREAHHPSLTTSAIE